MMSNGIYVIETDCMLPVDALTPYSKNAKKHPKEQIEISIHAPREGSDYVKSFYSVIGMPSAYELR